MAQHRSTFILVDGVLWFLTSESIMIMFDKFLEAGFTEFESILHDRSNKSCQKWIRDDVTGEKRFMLNVYKYLNEYEGEYSQDAYEAEAQLKDYNGDYFNVLLIDVKSVENVVSFFRRMYTNMECLPY